MKLNNFSKIIIVILIGATTIIGLSGLIFIKPTTKVDAPQNVTQNNQQDIKNNNLTSPTMNKINITTEDGKKIVGNYYQPSEEIKGWVLYLHMMPATKESYSELASRLQMVKYVGLAIDLRGHGESQDGPDGYKKYSLKETMNSIKDIVAAIDFLKKQGASLNQIYIVGASIGANLAIEYASQYNEIKKIVALSPGTNYYGIKAGELVKNFNANQKLFIVGSKDDTNVPGDDLQIQKISKNYPYKDNIIVNIYETGGHGTDILKSNPDVEDNIVEFLVD